jgi:hypothetical protein
MYWNVKRSGPLCAKDQLTLFFYVTADNKEDWQNGIFHNGKYGIFKFETESKKLSLISSQSCMPKFRKCNCASETIAEQKITVWLNQYLNACPLEAPRAA